jgi:hypothetical protein
VGAAELVPVRDPRCRMAGGAQGFFNRRGLEFGAGELRSIHAAKTSPADFGRLPDSTRARRPSARGRDDRTPCKPQSLAQLELYASQDSWRKAVQQFRGGNRKSASEAQNDAQARNFVSALHLSNVSGCESCGVGEIFLRPAALRSEPPNSCAEDFALASRSHTCEVTIVTLSLSSNGRYYVS